MNKSFKSENSEHGNLIAKLNNSISDLHFYAWRFLQNAGLECEPRTAVFAAMKFLDECEKMEPVPTQLAEIVKQYYIVK